MQASEGDIGMKGGMVQELHLGNKQPGGEEVTAARGLVSSTIPVPTLSGSVAADVSALDQALVEKLYSKGGLSWPEQKGAWKRVAWMGSSLIHSC